MRDIVLGSTIYIKFTTRAFATGVPTTLAGIPVLSIYEENNLTQITTGVSLTVDYDSVTGLNQVAIIATLGNGYEAGKSYDLVVTSGTVGGVSIIGEVVGSFTVGSSAAFARLGIPVGISIAADIAAIKSDTAEIGIAGVGLTNIGTIAAVTNLTNLPTIPANWLTSSGIAASAMDGKGDWNIGRAGYSILGTLQTLDNLNNFDPVNDTVANVTLVGLNADMRGTDGAALATVCTETRLAELDAANIPNNIDSISTDTGTTLPAQITALNNFNPATENVNSFVQGFLSNTITEVTAGRIANNFDTFFDNADVNTVKLVDDVGGGGSGSTDWTTAERNEIRGRLGITGITAIGGNAPTLALEASLVSPDNASIALILADTSDMQPKFGTPSVSLAADIAVNAVHMTDMKGSTFNGTTDSLEAIRDRGDIAWITGGAGAAPTVVQIRQEMDANSTQFAAIVLDTGTTLPAQITALNNFNPAIDTVVNVTNVALVATCTVNTDMRGTNGANTVVPDNVSISTILTDTGTSLPNQISALNNIAASEIVSNGAINTLAGSIVNVDLVDICTLNSDMVSEPDNTTIVAIAADLSNATDGLGALKAAIDTNTVLNNAIKAKTDPLTFTKANELDSNEKSINSTTIIGNGSTVPFNV